jgi:hypothetical protein
MILIITLLKNRKFLTIEDIKHLASIEALKVGEVHFLDTDEEGLLARGETLYILYLRRFGKSLKNDGYVFIEILDMRVKGYSGRYWIIFEGQKFAGWKSESDEEYHLYADTHQMFIFESLFVTFKNALATSEEVT